MPQTALPNLGLDYEWDLGNDAWKTGMDDNLALLDNLVMPNVNFALRSVSAQPGSPANGDAYIIGASPSGADWGVGSPDKEDWFAVFYSGTSTWHFAEPREGWKIYDRSVNTWYQYTGTEWVTAEMLEYVLHVSDLTTPITVADDLAYIRVPRAMTIVEVKASLFTAQQGSPNVSFEIDIQNNNKSPLSIFSTRLSIDNGERTSETAAIAAVIDDGAVAEDDELTVDVTVAGIGGAGLIVTILAVLA